MRCLTWRDDLAMLPRASFRGFEILSRGKRLTGLALDGPPVPDLFVKGAGLYGARLNPESPLGTIQSIEHVLRSLDKLAEQEQERAARFAKNLADYREQADKPFEHEVRLKTLLARQTELNAALDLDKNERQIAPAVEEDVEPESDVLQNPSIPPRVQWNSAPGMSPGTVGGRLRFSR